MLKGQTDTMNLNTFSLVRINADCYYEDVSIDFSAPFKYSLFLFSLNKASNSIVPTFCKDRKYYTPGFILPR